MYINSDRGFTLLEVLVAVVITFLMVGVIYGSYRGVFGTMQKSKRVFSDYQTISHLLRRMNEEITSAFVSSDLPFVGGKRELEFFTTKNAGISDLGKINYFLRQNEEGIPVLFRRESIPFSKIPGIAFSLASIEEISFQYFDGEEWSSEWDTETKLPRAVAIEIGLKEGTSFSTLIVIRGQVSTFDKMIGVVGDCPSNYRRAERVVDLGLSRSKLSNVET